MKKPKTSLFNKYWITSEYGLLKNFNPMWYLYNGILLNNKKECKVVTVAPWPVYRFLRRQVRWSGTPVSLRIFHTVKGFSVVSEADVHVFFWNSLSFSIIQRMLAIWSLVPLLFLNPVCTSGSCWFTYYWSITRRILSLTMLTWNERNCMVVWTFFGIALLWDWNENWPFSGLWPCLFSKFAGILSTAL